MSIQQIAQKQKLVILSQIHRKKKNNKETEIKNN